MSRTPLLQQLNTQLLHALDTISFNFDLIDSVDESVSAHRLKTLKNGIGHPLEHIKFLTQAIEILSKKRPSEKLEKHQFSHLISQATSRTTKLLSPKAITLHTKLNKLDRRICVSQGKDALHCCIFMLVSLAIILPSHSQITIHLNQTSTQYTLEFLAIESDTISKKNLEQSIFITTLLTLAKENKFKFVFLNKGVGLQFPKVI